MSGTGGERDRETRSFSPLPLSPPMSPGGGGGASTAAVARSRLNPAMERASSSSGSSQESRDHLPHHHHHALNQHSISTSTSSSSSSQPQQQRRSFLPHSRSASRQGGAGDYNRDSNATLQQQLDPTTMGVLTGTVGGSFGPFPRSSTYSTTNGGVGAFSRRDSMASSDVAIDLMSGNGHRSASPGPEQAFLPTANYNRYSVASMSSEGLGLGNIGGGGGGGAGSTDSPRTAQGLLYAEPDSSLLWTKENAEDDDYLHNADPALEKMLDRETNMRSIRGYFNVGILSLVIIVLVGLFAGWPIYNYAIKGGFPNDNGAITGLGWNLGGINGSGQVPAINGLPTLIDKDTPADAMSRTGFDGDRYNLVFSDEFNVDGRTFWPGDDPWWEAVDLHYWGTVDLEWYDPDAITTKDGKLEILMTQEPIHNLNFRSGMLQSWNKLCFTGGYIEVSMSFPGNSKIMGFWPGAWTMGNLGRPGYGATNHGVWPYTYNECDVGTLPNQTWPNGTDPVAARTSGDPGYGGALSWLPGQRLSACTCPGEDHPGPRNSLGRGAPEIDINEMQVDLSGVGSTSQSIQFAPIDAGYLWKNETPETTMFNTSITFQNIWHGSVNQESASVITLTDDTSYEGAGYTSFGFEYEPGSDGRITWAVNATPSWELSAAAMGPNADAQIGQRLVSEEPMSIILNLAISEKFQPPEWGKMTFPGTLRFDYVRVYQKGTPKVTCDPDDYPTHDYIQRHLDVYNNPNITTWTEDNGLVWPKNSLMPGGCSTNATTA